MEKAILTDYWRSANQFINFGDYITEVLLNKLGYKVELYHKLASSGRLDKFDRCLLVIGSLFEGAWFNKIKLHKEIWGCGFWGDPNFSINRLEECTVHLVRGPLTKSLLNLPDHVPVGDPALLMATLCPLRREPVARVAYVPHFNSRDLLPSDVLTRLGADELIDVACQRDSFWSRVQSIVNADFVLTSSLHAAIVAESYGRPWALTIPPGMVQDKSMKWADWFLSLELQPKACQNIEEAKEWWHSTGCKRRKPDLDAILNAFPHHVAK